MKTQMIRRVLRFVLWVTIAVVVFGFAVMSLWNWLMPALFGWKVLGFWQAVGLVVLSRILFGGFHGHMHGSLGWRHRMRERWEQMTPEEREKFRAGLRRRCGHFDDLNPQRRDAEAQKESN